jgi:hypothetical protein
MLEGKEEGPDASRKYLQTTSRERRVSIGDIRQDEERRRDLAI